MTKFATTSEKYAKLPTFAEVFDVLVAGFGINTDDENSLRTLEVFEHRVRLYSGSDVGGLRNFSKEARNKSDVVLAFEKHKNKEQRDLKVSENKGSPGLSDELLSLLAGDDDVLKGRISYCIDILEEDIAFGRSFPLITTYSEENGLRCFIIYWAVPWFVSLMSLADGHSSSVLSFIKKILLQEKCTGSVYLQIWRNFIKSLIPKGVRGPEFRSAVDKIKSNSLRKLKLIKKDVSILFDEIKASGIGDSEAQVVTKKIQAAYIAGMATLRFQSMVQTVCPELNLIDCLVHDVRENEHLTQEAKTTDVALYLYPFKDPPDSDVESFHVKRKSYIAQRLMGFWQKIGYQPIPDSILSLSNPREHCWDEAIFFAMLDKVDLKGANEIFLPYVQYVKGIWHLGCAELDLAEKYLMEFVSFADYRQLGLAAKNAASLLIALRLLKFPAPKSQELNPLIKIRIESMQQERTRECAITTTPFSDFSWIPGNSMYDLQVMSSVYHFNQSPSAPGRGLLCDPLRSLCMKLSQYVLASRTAGAKLSIRERNAVAIFGTSIKTYDAVCYLYFYSSKLFGEKYPRLGIMNFLRLPYADRRRVLRYIDEERYLQDCAHYEISP